MPPQYKNILKITKMDTTAIYKLADEMKIIKTYWGNKEQEIISEKEISEIDLPTKLKEFLKVLKR